MPLGSDRGGVAELMSWKPKGARASTFGGNPGVGGGTALATIELLEQDLVENAGLMGARLMDRLRELAEAVPNCLATCAGWD